MSDAPSSATPETTISSGRYRITRALGSGGMAMVHEAHDTVRGTDVALKRLRTDTDPAARRRGIAHLEREFHTLSQLAHPRVVQVFDYGVDCGDPYYTMELLDGGDLQERTPLEWRTACAVAIDICSALSLMHSRRLVHRDLSPRNVRCTSDGRAKLIDFGAMVAMGPSTSVVGTPAICAPELVRLQSLDGRTDLFALGATLYYTLTGRFPYPARTFAQLETMWKLRPPAPSEVVPGISPVLDALVMDLLQLDAALRPSNASEVMQRLRAAAGLAVDEQLLVSQAYLATPSLVGRDTPVARMRRYTSALCNGRGRAVLIDGPPGVGRTRFLDACVLEGKLAGAAVIRADPTDSLSGEFGAARALGRRLLASAA
jgi:serine/threonine protein kinase